MLYRIKRAIFPEVLLNDYYDSSGSFVWSRVWSDLLAPFQRFLDILAISFMTGLILFFTYVLLLPRNVLFAILLFVLFLDFVSSFY